MTHPYSRFGAEFSNNYRPVMAENVHDFPVEHSLADRNLGLIRPYGFITRVGGNAVILALNERDQPLLASMDYWPGFHSSPGREVTPRRFPGQSVPEAYLSFQYYKAGPDGLQEARFRDLYVSLEEVSVAFGVHPAHQGETPTWYIRGRHVGYSIFSEAGLIPDEPATASRTWQLGGSEIKNFSLARVVDGPLGDPCFDAGFRERMGIAEVPHRPV